LTLFKLEVERRAYSVKQCFLVEKFKAAANHSVTDFSGSDFKFPAAATA
jgi:hypothetical protein